MARMSRKTILPLIPVRGLVIFPYMIMHFDVARKKSVAALEAAMASGQQIFLTSQKDISVENPTPDDFYQVGTVSRVKQLLKLPGDTVRVLVEGLYRARITEITKTEPYFECSGTELRSLKRHTEPLEEEAAIRMISDMFDEYFEYKGKGSEETLKLILDIKDIGQFADTVAANYITKIDAKQEILEERDAILRATKLAAALADEIEVLKAENDIRKRVKEQVDRNQREYYLREQLRAISVELDGDDADEADEYKEKIEKMSATDEIKEKLLKDVVRLEKMNASSAETAVIRNYLDFVIGLPFGIKTEENTDIKKAEKILERDHYGLKKVKERILENLAVRILTGKGKGQIICFVGPPGVGKTSIVRSIAEAMGRNYARISLGGVRDEAEIRGHRKTYVGAMPGRILSAVNQAKSANAVILLDEIDKLGNDFKGDPSSALLEVLDAEQNFSFRDHFAEIPFDLSDTMFITTANDASAIPAPLYDRMEIIEISSYTPEEKYNIARKYLLPKAQLKNGIEGKLKISKPALELIIDDYTRESGVRGLEREITALCRKCAKRVLEGAESVSVTPLNLEEILGKKKYLRDNLSLKSEVGVVTGLAWTAVGGETLTIEVNVIPGTGKTEFTGNLGEVMKESAQAALSFIGANAELLGIDLAFKKDKDINIHIPEGAVPKDGPSAGITMATAVISALTNREVRGDIAMTGEVTIRGRVLPIGGLKEKAMAAYRLGIKKVLIPLENLRDLDELPKSVKEKLLFVPVCTMSEVLKEALAPKKDEVPFALPIEITEQNEAKIRI